MAPDITAGADGTGTTNAVGVTDDYGPSASGGCPAGGLASGRDVAYALSPAATTNYRIVVTPIDAAFDPMLYVQTQCGANACLGGTVLNGPGQPETLDVTVPGGTVAYLIVDGENVTRGAYRLEVTVRP